jgi:cation-transporting ATPase E
MTAIRNPFKKNAPSTGQNEIGRSYWHILSANLFSYFHLILFAVGIILIAFGRYNDAFITVITALLSTLIRTFQEVRAKRQLDQIALLVRPAATVVRGGAEQTVDAASLLKDDVIHLRTGDQALADGMVSDGMAELESHS